MTLGRYPRISLAKARELAAEVRRKVRDQSRDPIGEEQARRDRERAAPTVTIIAHQYLTHHAFKNKLSRSAQEDQRILHKDVLPLWHNDHLIKSQVVIMP